jgi:hypothetical protein
MTELRLVVDTCHIPDRNVLRQASPFSDSRYMTIKRPDCMEALRQRLCEHLALPGHSIARRFLPLVGVSASQDPAGGNEESAAAALPRGYRHRLPAASKGRRTPSASPPVLALFRSHSQTLPADAETIVNDGAPAISGLSRRDRMWRSLSGARRPRCDHERYMSRSLILLAPRVSRGWPT